MKGNILKLLEENIRLYLYDFRERKDLLNKMSKEEKENHKEKLDIFNHVKLQN